MELTLSAELQANSRAFAHERGTTLRSWREKQSSAWSITTHRPPLLTFPNRGRPGKREGTRELVLAPLPYVVVYTVQGDVVLVVRILHGAQQWP